jgi:hypothetical protein
MSFAAMAVFFYLDGQEQGSIVVERESYGGDTSSVSLKTEVDDEDVAFNVDVYPFLYDESDMEEVFNKGFDYIDSVYLGDNQSADKITSQMNLVENIDDLGLTVSWYSDNEDLISSKGEVVYGLLEEPELVSLEAVLSYDDYRAEREYQVNVYGTEKSKAEQVVDMLKSRIEALQVDDNRAEKLVIPDEIEGYTISEDGKASRGFVAGILGCVLCILICLKGRQDMKKKEIERNDRLMMDYPGFVDMLTLYMGAGLTVKGALIRIAEKGNSILNDEIKYTINEIQSGISEEESYYELGRRLNISVYMKITSLLSQNIKKGTKDILDMLMTEEASALQFRKELAKKKGEEASTKLLFPMIILLGIVMIIVVMPVFLSF